MECVSRKKLYNIQWQNFFHYIMLFIYSGWYFVVERHSHGGCKWRLGTTSNWKGGRRRLDLIHTVNPDISTADETDMEILGAASPDGGQRDQVWERHSREEPPTSQYTSDNLACLCFYYIFVTIKISMEGVVL